MNVAAHAALLAAILREDFPSFTEKVFHTVSPGQTLVRGWAFQAIAYQLDRVRRGEIKRLIINLPPRSLKSIMTSVAFPAYLLRHDPSLRIICASYGVDLARKHSNDFRAVLESGWFRALFPGTRIGRYKNTEAEVELTRRGFRLATSVGGPLTGRGGNLLIIDDPLKPGDALSDPKREGANQWFTNTLLSRLDDKRTGAIVVVMQRVHMDDLSGYLLRQSDEWTVLSLPAIAEHDETIQSGPNRFHVRRAGDVLSPEREPMEVLESLRRDQGSDIFSAQYQQAPVPPGGAMIKRAWIRRYTELPLPDDILMVTQSWDTAMKGGPDNDWSVCTTWYQTRDLRWYLIHVWRDRVDYPTLKQKAAELAISWGARQVLIEESGTAVALIAELQSKVMGITAVKPDKDKITRMSIASAQFEAGQVFLPQRAPWLPELEAGLFSFPNGRHDDQVDSISQLLNHPSEVATWLKFAGIK